MSIRIGSQTGNNYGFEASREKPLLFQVEQDISEQIRIILGAVGIGTLFLYLYFYQTIKDMDKGH